MSGACVCVCLVAMFVIEYVGGVAAPATDAERSACMAPHAALQRSMGAGQHAHVHRVHTNCRGMHLCLCMGLSPVQPTAHQQTTEKAK